jgi:hypothetical protein
VKVVHMAEEAEAEDLEISPSIIAQELVEIHT